MSLLQPLMKLGQEKSLHGGTGLRFARRDKKKVILSCDEDLFSYIAYYEYKEMLIILGGLPGVGKSTIGKKLAHKIGAVYLHIDSIEQAIKDAAQYNSQNKTEVVAEGYMVAYSIARDNLEIGLTVIADSVNPIEITRSDYRRIAKEANLPYFEVEIVCSDIKTHKERIATRVHYTRIKVA